MNRRKKMRPGRNTAIVGVAAMLLLVAGAKPHRDERPSKLFQRIEIGDEPGRPGEFQTFAPGELLYDHGSTLTAYHRFPNGASVWNDFRRLPYETILPAFGFLYRCEFPWRHLVWIPHDEAPKGVVPRTDSPCAPLKIDGVGRVLITRWHDTYRPGRKSCVPEMEYETHICVDSIGPPKPDDGKGLAAKICMKSRAEVWGKSSMRAALWRFPYGPVQEVRTGDELLITGFPYRVRTIVPHRRQDPKTFGWVEFAPFMPPDALFAAVGKEASKSKYKADVTQILVKAVRPRPRNGKKAFVADIRIRQTPQTSTTFREEEKTVREGDRLTIAPAPHKVQSIVRQWQPTIGKIEAPWDRGWVEFVPVVSEKEKKDGAN